VGLFSIVLIRTKSYAILSVESATNIRLVLLCAVHSLDAYFFIVFNNIFGFFKEVNLHRNKYPYPL
jgi:hypothetical protein